MNFDDIKDRIKSEALKAWDNFQESSFYNQLRDRFENLSPFMQKVTLFAVVALLLLTLISFPMRYYSSSADYVSEFNEKRSLIVDLLKTVKDTQNLSPQDTMSADLTSISNRISSDLKNSDLSPDQVSAPEVIQEKSTLVPDSLNGGSIRIRLSKLNVKQLSDFGYQFQNIHPRLKLKDMIVENDSAPGYFNVTYKLINIAAQTPAPAPTDKTKKSRN